MPRGRPKDDTRPCCICGSTHPHYKVGTRFYCHCHRQEAREDAKKQAARGYQDTRWLAETIGKQFGPTVLHIT